MTFNIQFPALQKMTCKDCGAGGSVTQSEFYGSPGGRFNAEAAIYRCPDCTVKEEARRKALEDSDTLKKIDEITETLQQLRSSVMQP